MFLAFKNRMLPLLAVCLFTINCIADDHAKAVNSNNQAIAINTLLDDFHDAAAKADKDRYLGHFTNTGVFLGTDDWERWPLQEFTEYVTKGFADGTGWVYVPESREIIFDPSGAIAWFDEITVSEKWGRFRGTGMLRKIDGKWKIQTYSLSVLVPNESWEAVSKINKAEFAKRKTKSKK